MSDDPTDPPSAEPPAPASPWGSPPSGAAPPPPTPPAPAGSWPPPPQGSWPPAQPGVPLPPPPPGAWAPPGSPGYGAPGYAYGYGYAAPVRTYPLRGLARALTIMLAIAAVLTLASAAAQADKQAKFDAFLDYYQGPLSSDLPYARLTEWSDAEDTAGGVAVATVLCILATAPVFIVWMWRAAKNLDWLGRRDPYLGPGWAIGGWFIPLANLVLPFLVALGIWKGTNPDTAPHDPSWRSRPIGSPVPWLWWGFMAASSVASTIAGGVGPDRYTAFNIVNVADAYRAEASWLTGSMILLTIAAVFLIAFVRKVVGRFEESYRRVASQAASPNAL